MRVGSIIREPLTIQHVGSRQQQQQRVFELLDEVGLPRNAVERYPHEFSGGQRQRIGLARALTLNPKVIVADEPVSALDVSIRAQVLNLMKRLQADHGLTYIVISHDLAVVKYMADRIGVMYLGKLVEMGSADDIYQRAAHPYTAGLIATIPVPDPGIAKATRGGGDQGRAAQPGPPAVGLPVPHPVPVRAGHLRRGGAAAALVRARARGRLPLPAADRAELGAASPVRAAAAPSSAATASLPSEARSIPAFLNQDRRGQGRDPAARLPVAALGDPQRALRVAGRGVQAQRDHQGVGAAGPHLTAQRVHARRASHRPRCPGPAAGCGWRPRPARLPRSSA